MLKNIFNIEINNRKTLQMVFSFTVVVLGDNQSSCQVAGYKAAQTNKKLNLLSKQMCFY